MDKRRYTLSDFDYELPKELIAQEPMRERAGSRLMVLDRKHQNISHHQFGEIINFFNPGDLLVLNNTKVFKARLLARKKTGGRVEILFLKRFEDNCWEALINGGGKIKEGAELFLGETSFKVLHKETRKGSPLFKIEVGYDGDFFDFLEKNGLVPLPPYISRLVENSDLETYQTVYAERPGASAAPTAGLHFTEELLQKLQRQGIEIGHVTLHVGYGTFSPVKTENLEEHDMHEEEYEITEGMADKINRVRKKGSRIFGCGTTTLRTLESALDRDGNIRHGKGCADLFIYPPAQVRSVDALITNFHTPKSTLLMLVSAFAGYDFIRKAYQEAIQEKYRFFSYGDAMLIL